MSLQSLTLGERIVMAARVAAAEHLRQDADSAGINVRRLQREMEVVRTNAARAAFARGEDANDAFRQDLYRQPVVTTHDDGPNDRRAA